MKHTELLIPIWPHQSSTWGKIGSSDYGDPCCSVDSIYIPLRARPTDDGYYGSYNFRVWQDIAIYMWVHKDGKLGAEIKAYNVHSAGLEELSVLTKKIKWGTTKMPNHAEWRVESLGDHLVELCKNLGIVRSVLYGGYGSGGNNEYVHVGRAIDMIVADVIRRHARLAAMP